MGRQAHLARLALGRSPYEAPLLDEDGEFILGPNVQHDTAKDYIQEFDSRGHPQNLESELYRKRLIRAQNDALSTVGVVVRKAKRSRTSWQKMTEDQKHHLLLDENVAGANYGLVEDLVQRLATRWVIVFRRRLLTFKSYLGLPITRVLFSEWKTHGFRAFLFAGYPMAAIASVSASLRDDLVGTGFPVRLNRSSNGLSFGVVWRIIRLQCFRLGWFAAEYPFHACSVLQSLHLLPWNAVPPLLEVFPYAPDASITMPSTWPTLSASTLLVVARHLLLHPFTLAYIKDQVGTLLETRLYLLVRHMIAKPDRPDRLSLRSARREGHRGAGNTKRTESPAARTNQAPSTLWESLGKLFPAVFMLWERLLQARRAPLAVELSPDIEMDLIQQSSTYYRNLSRRELEAPIGMRRPSRDLRIMAIRAAFNDYNLDPEHAMVDIVEWADGSSGSTSTPDPEELLTLAQVLTESRNDVALDEPIGVDPPSSRAREFIPNNVEHHAANTEARVNPQEPAAVLPSETVEGSSASAEPIPPPPPAQSTIEDRQMDHGTEPSQPALGISRTSSLHHTVPRPTRRLTDVIESQRPSFLREEIPQLSSEASAQANREHSYRVTTLSNHPAETLALGTASLLKTVLMLPLDVLFYRTIARNFLLTKQGQESVPGLQHGLSDIWSSADKGSTSVNNFSWLHFFNSWSLTIGTEAVIRFLVWRGSTALSLQLGREFGWGEF